MLKVDKIFLFEMTKKAQLQIEFLGKVESLNVLLHQHWAVRDKTLKEITEQIFYIAREKFLKIPQFEHVKNLSLIYFFKDNRARDYDNYSGKILIDAVKKAGILKDDSCKIIRKLEIKILLGQEKDKIIITVDGKLKKEGDQK